MRSSSLNYCFFFNDPATTEIYTLSLHDALPICQQPERDAVEERAVATLERRVEQVPDDEREGEADRCRDDQADRGQCQLQRSEEHTSELQSPCNLVCRLLLEKKID